MRCPYCGTEMASGYIPNGSQPVQWLPEHEKPSLLSFSVAAAGVPLNNKFAPFRANGYQAEAHFCASCKLVIAPAK